MDDETLALSQAGRPRLPVADMPEIAPRDVGDRSSIFRSLVADDSDITGLVAYSIYKQNKLDWLEAFEAAKARAPDEAELASYIVGEGTPRRLATYRHLAEATLSGKGPDGPSARTGGRAARAEGGALTPVALAAYAVILLALVAGFWLALHYTMSSR